MLFIKAVDFLKAIKKDPVVWKNFETHCQRKQGESENRVAQIKHVLEEKFDQYHYNGIKSTGLIDRILENGSQSRQNKNVTQKKITSFDGFSSDNNITYVKDNFKRIAYQRVAELEMIQVSKPEKEVQKSMIFSDGDGNFSISRANNPFPTNVRMLESKEFMPVPKMKRKNLNKSIDKSQTMFSELSESIDLDTDERDEDNSDSTSNFNARNIPCLQSICQKLWKKPNHKESYGVSNNGSTLYSSIR